MLNEWIDWNGGDCPVPKETEVKIQMRDGSEAQDYAGRLHWDHLNFLGDILKYQVPPTPPAARDRINTIKETIAKLDKERAELLEFIRSEGFVLVDEDASPSKAVIKDMADLEVVRKEYGLYNVIYNK